MLDPAISMSTKVRFVRYLLSLISFYNFVMDCDLFLASPNTYPVAAGLNPPTKGIGNGGFRHEFEKKTGWVVAGLYIGGGGGCIVAGAWPGIGDGGIASIWFDGCDCVCECVGLTCCWCRGFCG